MTLNNASREKKRDDKKYTEQKNQRQNRNKSLSQVTHVPLSIENVLLEFSTLARISAFQLQYLM